MYTTAGGDEAGGDENLILKKTIPTVCGTVIILLAICTVILALYWKFKIKLVRELKNTEGLERFVH
jgi:hypothetical protein